MHTIATRPRRQKTSYIAAMSLAVPAPGGRVQHRLQGEEERRVGSDIRGHGRHQGDILGGAVQGERDGIVSIDQRLCP